MEEMKKQGWEFMGHGTTNSEPSQHESRRERESSGGTQTIKRRPDANARLAGRRAAGPTTLSTFSPKRASSTAATGTRRDRPIR
jgi:hypothetical protein